jgi:hypothetical protein
MSYSAKAVLRSLPGNSLGTLTHAGASCDCAFTRRSYSSAPSEYGDEHTDALALWFVAAELPALPATYDRVTVTDDAGTAAEWKVAAVNRIAGGLVRLELS